MKAQTLMTFIFLLISFISYINTDANTYQDIIHIDSEFAKVCTLEDKSLLILSSVRGVQKTKESKIDEKGNVIYGNSTLNLGYTGSAQVVQPHSVNGVTPNYFLYYHNRQNLLGQSPVEYTAEFNQGVISRHSNRKNSIYKQKSLVALKSGKVFMAGLNPPTVFGANTTIEVNIFDPITNKNGQGLTFNDATSKYVSCFELKENNVYCVYVSFENVFVTKLRIKHIKINDMTLSCSDQENKKVIKTFYTEFNFLKAVKFNDTDALVLFQTGNTKNTPRYGNSGKDLYFYHLEIKEDSVHVKRYEYLYDKCLYKEDAEDYNADIAVLSENRIFVVCETEPADKVNIKRFLRGFIIYPNKENWDEFNFNSFGAVEVKNPVFAKFDKSLGIFYTHISANENSKVAYHIMNYPDCKNYRDETILLPQHLSREFDFSGKVFMDNAYPADRQKEEIFIRFNDFGNFTFYDIKEKKNIESNKDYDSSLIVKASSNNGDGIYSVEYTATRNDALDGKIIGRTCKINFNTPKCLDRCYSCTETGNEISHKCILDCADGPYYKEEDPQAVITDFGKTFNCPNCDKACSSCYGPFLFKPRKTTNCKKCDYNNGYYHFVDDLTVCISENTQEEWELYFNHSIYLDKTPSNKSEWRWKYCHPNCKKCHGPGTDEDNQCDVCIDNFYFYCNQTKGHGIPGSCHNDCVDNGFTLKENEGMLKCCPCSVGFCKVCHSDPICDNCFPPFFRNPDGLSCVPECGYCLAEDRQKWQCVNCKDSGLYNLNKTCVDESKLPISLYISDPYFEGKKHHVVDPQCNLVTGCKGGCNKCDAWYTEHCTECKSDYYKEDFFSIIQPNKTFKCFTENECKGIEQYEFDDEKVGGVPKHIAGELVCYNCRLREGNYRQVANNFTCGPKGKRTYIAIKYYNTLEECYLRCATCDDWGNSCFHNCTSCRTPSIYGLEPYNPPRQKYGNCIRYTHKCKNLPYYHDYDLADQLGIDEDNCGQDCDVCLTNGTCTENFPYYVIATRECVELCPFNEILSQTCLMNHPNAGFILLKNPFDLPNTFSPINQTVNINQVISSSIFQKFAQSYNIDITSVQNEINNYIGNGKVYNLPKSEIIIGNNISIELTSIKLELEKLAQKATEIFTSKDEEKEKENKTSIIDMSECAKILKEKYGLPEEEDLIIIKGDTWERMSEAYYGTQVDYQLFSWSLGAFLPLNDCKEKQAQVSVTNPFNIDNLLTLFQSKTKAVISNGYAFLDSNSPFYHDICTPFTNENGNDVLLDDRIQDYFNNIQVCEDGCTFVSYNASNNYYTCNCPIKDSINQKSEISEPVSQPLPESFYKKHKNSNIEVFKCASQVFSSKGQSKNFGSYVLILCLACFVGSVVYYFIKGTPKLDETFRQLSQNPVVANPPKPGEPSPSSGKDINGKIPNNDNKNAIKDKVINEEQLNNADFTIAKKHDKRGYLSLYWSLLKMKQMFIFTFYTSTDYNVRIVKIALFILFFAFYFAFTALFFNDKIMRSIYIYKGNTDAAVHVPNIILSSLCCIIMNFIVRFVTLSERDISKINCETNAENKKKLCESTKKILKIKLIILFSISFVLLGICWYYVAAFCAVFKNSQGHYFINVFVAFLVCNIWPCVTSLIPPIFRKYGINNNSSCMYKASQIIAYI